MKGEEVQKVILQQRKRFGKREVWTDVDLTSTVTDVTYN